MTEQTAIMSQSGIHPAYSGQFPRMPTVPPPIDHDTKPPFWARFGYQVAAAVVAAVLGCGSAAFMAYRALEDDREKMQEQWFEATRRIDSVEGRQRVSDQRLDAVDGRFTTLVTKGEFEAWSRGQNEVVKEIKEELIRMRITLERRR